MGIAAVAPLPDTEGGKFVEAGVVVPEGRSVVAVEIVNKNNIKTLSQIQDNRLELL
jgi:hypothetical protein